MDHTPPDQGTSEQATVRNLHTSASAAYRDTMGRWTALGAAEYLGPGPAAGLMYVACTYTPPSEPACLCPRSAGALAHNESHDGPSGRAAVQTATGVPTSGIRH